MAKKIAPLLPATRVLLGQFGDRLRLARLKRRLLGKQVAEAAGMSPMTLRSLERGGPGVTVGAYLAVMQVLGLEEELNLLARGDAVPVAGAVDVTGAVDGGREQRRLTAGSEERPPAETTARQLVGTAPETDRDDGRADVERIRRVIDAIPEERWRVLFDWLGQVPAVTSGSEGSPMSVGEQPRIEGASPSEADTSLHITFDWLDAPASDLRKLVKPVAAGVHSASQGLPREATDEARVRAGRKSRGGKIKNISDTSI